MFEVILKSLRTYTIPRSQIKVKIFLANLEIPDCLFFLSKKSSVIYSICKLFPATQNVKVSLQRANLLPHIHNRAVPYDIRLSYA